MLVALGIVVALFEKGNDFPIAPLTREMRKALSHIGPRWPALLDCPICIAFWAALISDALVRLMADSHYWLWPASGFSAMGITWLIYRAFPA